MPRRALLSQQERDALLAFPKSEEEWIRHYTLTDADRAVIAQHRGGHNRLGFAVQLCLLRYPGFVLQREQAPPNRLLHFVADQLELQPDLWPEYAQRPQTRREHLVELQAWLGLRMFGAEEAEQIAAYLTELAERTHRGLDLAKAMVETLRDQRVVLPSPDVIDRVCSQALTAGMRRVYESLTVQLSDTQREALDHLLTTKDNVRSVLHWLRQSPRASNAKHIMLHIERLKRLNDIELPEGLERTVHKNWLQRLAKEGGQMTAQHLRDLETDRRLATLVAVAFDTRATLIDETIELHDRIMGKLFSRAKRTHSDKFQKSGRAINDKLRLYTRIGNALLKAKESGEDPFSAIESILPWEDFRQSVTQAEELSQNESFDYLPLLASGFRQLRRYSPEFLAVLNWRAAPAAQSILDGIEVLKTMNALQKRKVPETAPVSFVRKRWEKLVFTADGIDRPFYELCVMSELRNSLRSGDIWVEGSRQFKDFEEYLVPRSVFTCQREQRALGLEVTSSCEQFLEERLGLLEHELAAVERLAEQKELPDALVTPTGLKVSPLANTVPEEAGALAKQVYSSLPHLKVTDLLLEVDRWTDFTRYFTHLKSGEPAANKNLLLTALLADAINLGLAKMTESCPGTTYAKLSWLQAWHIRDETYSKALAELVNTQSSHPLAAFWGDGTSSSSDGQNFKVGGRGRFSGQVNRKYGFEPGIQFYTHVSDQYSPFHTKIISTTIRDATHVLDGLLYHESELQIKEHYTDTSGFTDHVFALMHLLGYRFAPRIRGLSDKRLYITGDPKRFPALSGLIGGRINLKIIRDHWDEILRLAVSIKQGSVTASLMLRKLGSYPRQNRLSVALRELGRVERTLFTLEWLQDVELRRRVQSGLNKGEARNALARAVFFNQLGELRDRRFENQRYKASGLNLVVAAIILWNTVYLGRVIDSLREKSTVQEDLLQHLSPLGWSHINLTGDYTWEESKRLREGEFRPLRISRIS